MSDTNRVGLRFVKETSAGTTPTSPVFRELPTSSQSNLGFTPKTEESKLLADDRQTRDLILVGGEVGGDCNSELAFGIHDDILEGAMFSAWQARYSKTNHGASGCDSVAASSDAFTVDIGVTSGSLTVDFTGSTNDKVTRSSGSFITDGFRVGDYVIVSGAVDGGNNSTFCVTEVAALYMVLDGLPSDETADTGVTISVVLPAKAIIRAEGFTESANNGYFVVQSGTTATSIVTPDGRADESAPPETAQIHLVGFQAAAADIVATSEGLTSTLLNFLSLQLEPGDWMYITGSGGTWANIGYGRILSVSANALTWETAPSGWATDAGTGATVQMYLGDRLVNGVDTTTYSLERRFNDHDPVTYQYMRGMEVAKANIVAASQAVVQCNLSFVGRSSEFTETRFSGASDLDLDSFSVLNSSSNVGRIARDGVVLTGSATKNLVTQVSFEIENNLRRRNAISFIGASSVGAGQSVITGALDCYFDDKSIAEQIVNNTETSVDARFEDGDGHISLFDAPRIKYSEGYPAVSGKNADVTLSAKFRALRHATFGYQLKMQRFYGVNV